MKVRKLLNINELKQMIHTLVKEEIQTQRLTDVYVESEDSEFTFNQPRRRLNIPELIKRGAIFVTHPHGPNGWETDRPDWDFSLITLQNVLEKSPGWATEYKKYISKDKKMTQDFINKISDQKYQQILWSIKKLGIPDSIAFR